LRELYILARVFGISAHEALHERPAWELDSLLAQYSADLKRGDA
jgi:phosphotransferase system HPr-like phosphotransfer protein